uniref:Uncharacterized protein n=1 Tax=Trichobilharzia regenti TaxID=157069 RepID=A0AA85JRP0_TRIRE|nr:unnamed protein product [Trichobilharzia regenti]
MELINDMNTDLGDDGKINFTYIKNQKTLSSNSHETEDLIKQPFSNGETYCHQNQQSKSDFTDGSKSSDQSLNRRNRSCRRTTSAKVTTTTTTTQKEVYCEFCSRFYGTASLKFHQDACKIAYIRKLNEDIARQKYEAKLSGKPSHPPGVICYICGGRYTNASWKIHLARCLNRWITWNSLLPRKVRRKTLPTTPEPSEEEIQNRIRLAQRNGLLDYEREDALDDIMFEASENNKLPLEYI